MKTKNFIKLNSKDETLIQYNQLLNKIDRYISKNNDLKNAIYWSICQDNKKHNEIFCRNNIGKKIKTPWNDVIVQFPELNEYQNELGLHSYVGCTLAGNWGIHKHCYDAESYWNIAFFKNGCSKGAIEFYKEKNKKTNYSITSLEELDYGTPRLELVEKVALKNGDIISLNTLKWHSHTVRPNSNVRVFLNCIVNAKVAKKIHKSFQCDILTQSSG